MGQVAGYTAADYLIQHASRKRRYARVPASTWDAALCHIGDLADTTSRTAAARGHRENPGRPRPAPRLRRRGDPVFESHGSAMPEAQALTLPLAWVPQWDPDAGGPAYVYMRVADHIAARIAAGDLPAEARLPAERDLAAEYAVAIGTARRAVLELRDAASW